MSRLIIGLAGEIGCGKGTVVELMRQQCDIKVIRFSDCLRGLLQVMHVENSRENMQTLSTHLRNIFGQDVLSRVVLNDSLSASEDIIILDGVRRKDDIELFMTMPNFFLVYIDTCIEKRYERIIKRGENIGELEKTLKEFQKDSFQEAESQIRDLKPIAHYYIPNEGTKEELMMEIEKMIKEFSK